MKVLLDSVIVISNRVSTKSIVCGLEFQTVMSVLVGKVFKTAICEEGNALVELS